MIDIHFLEPVSVSNESSRTPLLCITDSSITFGAGVLAALKRTAYAKVLVGKEDATLYLCCARKEEENAFPFLEGKPEAKYVRMKSLSLRRVCDELSGKSKADYPYRIKGYVDFDSQNNPVVVFPMKTAYPRSGK